MTTLSDALMVNEEKKEGLESHVTLDTKALAHLATVLNDRCRNILCVAAESGELRWWMNAVKGNALRAVSSGKQLQTMVSAMARERDA